MKFSTKLTLIFSSVVLTIGAVISYFVYSSNVKTLEGHIKDRLMNQAFHTTDKIDRMLFERYADIKALASDPVIMSRKATTKQITEKLMAYKNNYKTYTSLSFFDLNRIRIADTEGIGIGSQHSFSKYWPGISRGMDFTYDISVSESLKKTVFHFAAIVKDEKGNSFGVVVSRTLVENLYDIIVGIYNIEKDFKVEMVDKDGIILYSNQNKEATLKKVSVDWDTVKKPLMQGVKAGVIRQRNPKEAEEEILVFVSEHGYQDYKGNNWTFLVSAPTKVVFASAIELNKQVITLLLVIAFPAFLLIYFLSSKLSRSIEELSEASVKVAAGDLDLHVKTVSRDEIGSLSVAFNKMVDDLKNSRDKLLAYSGELEKTVMERTAELQKQFADRIRLEAELKKKDKLESIGILAGGMAHDFNNLLTGILGNISLTKMHMRPDNKDYSRLSEAENICVQMTELTGKIITFSEGGNPFRKVLSISSIINETACSELCGPNISCQCDFSEGLFPVYVDDGQIRQVFRNMVINAKEAMPEGGIIRVRVENIILDNDDPLLKKGKYVKITIKDSGKGIPEEILPNIFDPYFSTKEMGSDKGMGLGLSVCYSIIKKHDGHITVESKAGEGATFHIYLPAVEEI